MWKKLLVSVSALAFVGTVAAQIAPSDTRTLLEKRISMGEHEYRVEKTRAIAKVGKQRKVKAGDYSIEILSIDSILGEDGTPAVKVRAKAWDANGKRIGFGKDGSVEIETFVYYNPRVFVPDTNGEYSRTVERDFIPVVERFREDPKQALYDSLAYTMREKKEKFDDRNIIDGKIGTTTSTFYPDANPETNSADCGLQYTAVGPAWSAIREAATGNNAFESTATFTIQSQSASCTDFQIQRGLFMWYTAALPDTDAVSSFSVGVFVPTSGVANGDNDGEDTMALYGSTHTVTNGCSTSDYDYTLFGTTVLSNVIDLTAGFTANAYNTFTGTAGGIASVSLTAQTRFTIREGHDASGNSYACGGGNTENRITVNAADTAGTTTDPILTVEHSAAASPAAAPRRGASFDEWSFIPKIFARK